MTHRGPFQPLPFCDSVGFYWCLMPMSHTGPRNSEGETREKCVCMAVCCCCNACSQQRRHGSCVLHTSIVRMFLQILEIFSYPSGGSAGSPREKRPWATWGAMEQLVSVQVLEFVPRGFVEAPSAHHQSLLQGSLHLSVCLPAWAAG